MFNFEQSIILDLKECIFKNRFLIYSGRLSGSVSFPGFCHTLILFFGFFYQAILLNYYNLSNVSLFIQQTMPQ